MSELIKKSDLPEEEIAICRRFAEIRKRSDLSQASFAKELFIPLGTVSNYEYCKTALRADIGLRACHTFLANERWLATGEGDWQPCVDLFLESSVLMKITRGELYSEAYHRVLAHEHDVLEQMPDDSLVLRLLTCELNTEPRIDRIFSFARFLLLMRFSNLKVGVQDKIGKLKDVNCHTKQDLEQVLRMTDTQFLLLFYKAGIEAALDFLDSKGLKTNPIIPAMRFSEDSAD